MTCETAQAIFSKAQTSAATIGLAYSADRLTSNSPSLPNQNKGITMGNAHGINTDRPRGVQRANRRRASTSDLNAWWQDILSNIPAKEIARDAGCGVRTAENVKQGRNGFAPAYMTTFFMNNPKIGAAYAEYVGVILPGQAEYADAITNFANAIARQQAGRAE